MILKKLVAQGFKSFADRIEFEFDQGITAIVGPNGCGKSNVVDAIRWVLGEQSAKSLRGRQMLDVIFNGSGTRKSAGMAQVDLIFDNADGALPIDQTEVIVSRRLYRSGESEYLLNKQTARLRDIKELFMDTGVGVDAYSVIEQGRVDALLQANPFERRVIFEEAAGISKFKARKKEAQRKLERVEQNLLRAQDIVDEIEKRLRSIKLAAGKARSFQQYSARLKELKSRYALASYHELRQRQIALEREAAVLTDQSTGLRARLSESEARSSAAQVRALELEREIGGVDSRLLTAQTQISGHEERVRATRQRAEEQTQSLERTRQRIEGLAEQVARNDEQVAAAQARHDEAGREFDALQARVAELQQSDADMAAEVVRAQNQLEDERSGVMELLRRTAALRNEIENIGREQTSLTGQQGRLAARDAEIAAQMTDLLSRRERLEFRRDEIARLMHEQRQALDDTRGRATAVTEQRGRLRDQIAAAKEYRSGLQSRLQTLEELDRRREGMIAGVREVLTRRDADPEGRAFSYVLGPVGELFEADVAHAGIIEAVLGELEQYLVVRTRDELLADRDVLAKIEGRVLAFCLDQIPAPISAGDITAQPGYVACAVDWVRVPAECEKLARHLLGRTFIVESIDDARRLSQMCPPGTRFVTLEGIVWDSDGRIALGSLGAGTGLISRRSELRELQDRIAEVESRIAELTAQLAAADGEAARLDALLSSLTQAVHDADRERAETETALHAAVEAAERLAREQPIIAAEAQAVARQMTEAAQREQSSRTELDTLEHSSTQRQQRMAELQAELQERAAQRRALSEQMTQARVAAGEAAQRRTALSEAAEAARAALEHARRAHDAAVGEVTELSRRIDEARAQIAESEAALDRLRNEATELTQRAAALRQEREQLLFVIDEQAGAQRQLRGELEGVESQLNERRMAIGEARVRIEDLERRMREELSVELAAQYATYQPENEDWSAVEAEIEDLRGKIERLGHVNLDAITEQEELEQRLSFLTGQRDDLRESERQLQELIHKLEDESKQRFRDTFEQIRTHFGDLFRKLFGGGRAEITLQDPEDVLECGIDITARPPGKEPQSIALLSGGEKTMTAIALLLAVFKTRPSPFTLLDEVDAALDEANNERFNRVIREFLSDSQFIIITHSKRTMSIADVLYGITMQEAGVSKRVAVRLEDEHGEPVSAVA